MDVKSARYPQSPKLRGHLQLHTTTAMKTVKKLTTMFQVNLLLLAQLVSSTDNLSRIDRMFLILVTVHWQERIPSGRTVKMVKHQDTKQVSMQRALHKLTRRDFVALTLSAHGYEDRYTARPVSGPAMRVFWTGCP